MDIIAINKIDKNISKINIHYREGLKYHYDNKDNYNFYCSCNRKTRMILGKRNNYYVQSMPGEKATHNSACIFKGESFKSLKGYYIDDITGELCFSVSEKSDKIEFVERDEDLVNNLIIFGSDEDIRRYFNGRGVKTNKLTFNAFATKMLINSWNNYYKRFYMAKVRSNSISLSRLNFLKYFYGKSNTYKYNNIVVNDALSKKDSRVWIEMGFITNIYDDYDNMLVTFRSGGNISIQRKVKKEMFDEVFDSIRVKTKNYIIFLKRNNENKYKTIEEIAIIPVNKYGLVSESSYEANFYENAVEANVLFKKPYEIYDNLTYPFVPDAIVNKRSVLANKNYWKLFNVSKDKEIVFELFGMQGNENYDELKNRKINIGSKLNSGNESSFSFIDVNSNGDIDTFFKK